VQELGETLNSDSEMAAMYLGRRAETGQQARVDGATSTGSSRLASLAEAIQPSQEEDPVSATAASQGRDPDAEPPTDSQPPDDDEQQVRWRPARGMTCNHERSQAAA